MLYGQCDVAQQLLNSFCPILISSFYLQYPIFFGNIENNKPS